MEHRRLASHNTDAGVRMSILRIQLYFRTGRVVVPEPVDNWHDLAFSGPAHDMGCLQARRAESWQRAEGTR